MKIDQIKEKLDKILINHSYQIFSIREKREFGERILEILIDGERIDTEVLEGIHQQLVEEITSDELDDNCYLELSSVGAERPIRTLDEARTFVGSYVYLESTTYRGSGTLVSIEENDILIIKINDKGRFKNVKVNYADAKNFRKAVKF